MPGQCLPIEVGVRDALKNNEQALWEEEDEISKQLREIPGNKDKEGKVLMPGLLGVTPTYMKLGCF